MSADEIDRPDHADVAQHADRADLADRGAELAHRLAAVEQRIVTACQTADRNRSELTVVVVTKTYPASDVGLLVQLGVTDVGEARHPEAGRKVAACAEAGYPPQRWHFVGAVQTNKAAAIAGYASVVHSVDRLRLVRALDRGAARAERILDCLVQLDLDPAAAATATDSRSGLAESDLLAVAEAIASAGALRLRGVMTVAPLGADPSRAFDRLADLSASLRAAHPAADVVSAGMSGDLEQAIQAGATHLRVGRAVLGERPALR